jgi:hypothetical protein
MKQDRIVAWLNLGEKDIQSRRCAARGRWKSRGVEYWMCMWYQDALAGMLR